MIGKARLFGFFSDRRLTGADVVDGTDDIEQISATDSPHEGPEILPVLFLDFTGNGDARKFLFGVHLDIRLGFVVFEENVVLGLVLFD